VIGQDAAMSDTSREVVRRVSITLLLVLAGGLLWFSGVRKGEPPEPSLLDNAVEQLIPAPGSPAVVRQAELGVDLAPGWTGILIVNGLEIPEDQLRRNEPLNQVFFRPGEGQEIEALNPGAVRVTAVIWRPADGQTRSSGARSLSWEFRVG
jgi:hypothetical protein